MATMIPGRPREYDPRSREGEIYAALEQLPDDYYVVHSYTLLSTINDEVRENEADFVVFHKDRGLVCIEAKAGRVGYSDGEWRYASGRAMRHGGPFKQAERMKWRIVEYFRELKMDEVLERCKVFHAVWFPSIRTADLSGVAFPSEADRRLALTLDDLRDPEPALLRIFSLKIGSRETRLSSIDFESIVKRILCPAFSITPTTRFKYDLADVAFARFLDSQTRVLDFLEDQRSAVINGVAGSGKTLVAVERAKRAASRGGKVLFLCYNAMLKDDIRGRCSEEEGIDVYTIAGFACKECSTPEPDYALLEDRLMEYADSGTFPYSHVVVDEGQDFGLESVDQANILELLNLIVGQSEEGSFYLFYDKNQLVQGTKMPGIVNDADCKLTLYVNCRNTLNIAECSVKALSGDVACKVREAAFSGAVPKMLVSCDREKQIDYIDGEIESLKQSGIADIVILTCKTEESTAFAPCVSGGTVKKWKKTGVPVYSCRRFKGLEADAVLLIDVDETLWLPDERSKYSAKEGLLFYTGASRAKYELRIVCDMSESNCLDVLQRMGIESRRKPEKAFAKALNAIPVF